MKRSCHVIGRNLTNVKLLPDAHNAYPNSMAPQDVPLAFSLLARAHSPESATRIYSERIHQRPLHISSNRNIHHEPTAQQARRLERMKKRLDRTKKPGKPAPLSSRQARARGLYDLRPSAQKYAIFAPLQRLWVAYIQEVLWDGQDFSPVGSTHAAKLCAADFHGAELEVVRSRCVSRVGVAGIVVKDARAVFELVTRQDQRKIIPKEGTVFRFCVPVPVPVSTHPTEPSPLPGPTMEQKEPPPRCVFELHGDQFRYRAADRANRKFKPHFLPHL